MKLYAPAGYRSLRLTADLAARFPVIVQSAQSALAADDLVRGQLDALTRRVAELRRAAVLSPEPASVQEIGAKSGSLVAYTMQTPRKEPLP